ncbi:MAG: globin family protein [Alphaproteobacteria bacterium]
MTPEQISLLQESFAELAPLRDAVAAAFYDQLFAIDPALAPMFAETDRTVQGRKLMAALALVVGSADRPLALVVPLQALARRHVGYGVEESHYETVGEALIDTLATHFGPRFTPALRDAWLAAYTLVSSVMIDAARAVPKAA